MYHDQGHIALKTVGFDRAVNVTLGLPIVRTSVAHGTAFDIAGKGLADPSSLIAAVRVAARIVAGRTVSGLPGNVKRTDLPGIRQRCRTLPPVGRTIRMNHTRWHRKASIPRSIAYVKSMEPAMNTIDYIYRFDPKNPSVEASPARCGSGTEDARRRQPDVRELDGKLPDQRRFHGRSSLRRSVQRPGSRHEPLAWSDAQTGAFRRRRRLLGRSGADRVALRPGVQRSVHHPGRRKCPG